MAREGKRRKSLRVAHSRTCRQLHAFSRRTINAVQFENAYCATLRRVQQAGAMFVAAYAARTTDLFLHAYPNVFSVIQLSLAIDYLICRIACFSEIICNASEPAERTSGRKPFGLHRREQPNASLKFLLKRRYHVSEFKRRSSHRNHLCRQLALCTTLCIVSVQSHIETFAFTTRNTIFGSLFSFDNSNFFSFTL